MVTKIVFGDTKTCAAAMTDLAQYCQMVHKCNADKCGELLEAYLERLSLKPSDVINFYREFSPILAACEGKRLVCFKGYNIKRRNGHGKTIPMGI